VTYPKTVVLRKMSGPRTVVCDSLCDPLTSKFRDSWCRMYCWIFSKISPRAVTEKERDCFSDLVFLNFRCWKRETKTAESQSALKFYPSAQFLSKLQRSTRDCNYWAMTIVPQLKMALQGQNRDEKFRTYMGGTLKSYEIKISKTMSILND